MQNTIEKEIYGIYSGKFGGLVFLALGLALPGALIVLMQAFADHIPDRISLMKPILPSARKYLSLVTDKDNTKVAILWVTSFYSVLFFFLSLLTTKIWRQLRFLKLMRTLASPTSTKEEKKGKIYMIIFLVMFYSMFLFHVFGWVFGIFSSCGFSNVFKWLLALLPCSQSVFDYIKINYYSVGSLVTFMFSIHLTNVLVGKKRGRSK